MACAPIACAAVVSESAWRPTRTTRARAVASATAVSKPIPRDAPVTTAVRPARETSATVVLDIVVDGLPQHETRQLRRLECRLEDTPEGDHDVFRRRNDTAQEIHLEVEIAVIDLVDRVLLDDLLHAREIDDVAGPFVDGTTHGDVEDIVVPVPVRIVALAEDAAVFFVGHRRVGDPMRGAEVQTARDEDLCRHP